MGPLSITEAADGVLDVALRGEIDYTNAEDVTETIRAAVRRVLPSAIRVDMSAVTFLDSSGIAVLVNAMKAAHDADADFWVEATSPRVFDQLELTGLTDLFPVAPTPARPEDG